jgi:hypothetical protein
LPSTDTHTGYYGLQPSMVLDENDDPMFTYFVGEDGGVYALYFTRWDPCAGAFTTPLLIDTLQYGITTGAAERNAAIAYDLTTKEIGIVYNPASAGNGPGDGNTYVVLATEKPGATTFTTQMASAGLSSVVGTSQPVIAMAQGQIYIAYVQGNFNCGSGGSCQGLQLLSSTTTAQPDAGPAADGGAPPHYFTEQAIDVGGVPVQARADALSIGIDASGRVGLAFFEEPPYSGETYNTTLMFWRSDMANAVPIIDTNNIQNDHVTAALRFEGTNVDIAADMTVEDPPPSNLFFATSVDGTTWPAPVYVTEDNMAGNGGATIALAMDGAGNGIITTDVNGGPSLCTDPYLAQTTDDGNSWASCVSDYAKGQDFSLGTMSAAYGQSRNKGKFILGFQNGLSDLDPNSPNGVWLYQSP